MSGFSLATSSGVTSLPFSKSFIDPDSSASKRRRKLANSSSGCMVTSLSNCVPLSIQELSKLAHYPGRVFNPLFPDTSINCGMVLTSSEQQFQRPAAWLAKGDSNDARTGDGCNSDLRGSMCSKAYRHTYVRRL